MTRVPESYDNDRLGELEHLVTLGDLLHPGDTVDYVDDGTGSGGFADGCGDIRDWDDIRKRLAKRDLRLVDWGGGYEVHAVEEVAR